MADPHDRVQLDDDDFRRIRAYLAPHIFMPYEEDPSGYPPPSDLIGQSAWEGIMDLPTDVALRTSSYTGSDMERINGLASNWTFSWPDVGEGGPYIGETCLLAGEELDALVFNTIHGYYRQAIACLRNALEIMTVSASLAVTRNTSLFSKWREGQEISFGQARAWLRDSADGRQLDADVAPHSVFGDHPTAWLKETYARLGGYAHSQAGYNNSDFWESNGPVYRPNALAVVEEEFRETLALLYLMLRIAWSDYTPGQGQAPLLEVPQARWVKFDSVLRHWLL
jgi:hypothetical protein